MTDSTSRAVPPAPELAGDWRLDPERTKVTTRVRAMFGLFGVTGIFSLRDGRLTIAQDPNRSSIQATIDASSYSSGNATRDKDVISPVLLDAHTYPDLTLSSTAVRSSGDGWIVEGSLGAHGVTVPIEMRVDGVRAMGEDISLQVSAELDRTAFGVTNKKGMVGRSVKVSVEVVGRRE